MQTTRTISIVAMLSSLIIATDWLVPFPNVKIVDTLVFAASYTFGFKVGAYVAIVSELIWGIFNPLGFGGPIIIFTVTGELIYAIAGWGASRTWGLGIKSFSFENLFFGGVLAVSAFLFDIETNLVTAFLIHWPPQLSVVLGTLLFGVPFMVTHEIADFALGASLAPVLIFYFSRRFVGDRITSTRGGAIEHPALKG